MLHFWIVFSKLFSFGAYRTREHIYSTECGMEETYDNELVSTAHPVNTFFQWRNLERIIGVLLWYSFFFCYVKWCVNVHAYIYQLMQSVLVFYLTKYCVLYISVKIIKCLPCYFNIYHQKELIFLFIYKES